MTKRIVNGIKLDCLEQLSGQVIEPVPENERHAFKYWRAANLGSIALNFIEGVKYLNSAANSSVFFWDSYSNAQNTAKAVVEGSSRQLWDDRRSRLSQLSGLEKDFVYPALILALDERFNDSSLVIPTRQVDPMNATLEEMMKDLKYIAARGKPDPKTSHGCGFAIYDQVRLDMIDPFSNRAIIKLFGLQGKLGNNT